MLHLSSFYDGRCSNLRREQRWRMLFNSYVFVFAFFPVVLTLFYVLNHYKKYEFSKGMLLVASLYFYAYFEWSYLWIMLLSIVLNFAFSKLFEHQSFIEKKGLRRVLLCIALAFNLGIIGYFKYYDFFIENINVAFGMDFHLIHVLLPLGISFFTFQQLSFVIDCYKSKAPTYKMLDYALFVTYFPQLIAGPIVTHDELVPQMEDKKNKRFNAESFAKGIMAFAFGIGKKVLIADTFGNAVNWGFANIASLSSSDALISMLAYTIQIYFDFSGYCDMATGIALMMNIKLPQNFNSPYRALSITEFWKRWHMTLTRFFTHYIYIPLGGNRKGSIRTYVNIFIVYLCSGIWHGANWTFIVWGVMHGIACILDRMTKRYTERWHAATRWLITFAFVNITWIFFRADSLELAMQMVQRIFEGSFLPVQEGLYSAFYTDTTKTILSWIMPAQSVYINSSAPAMIMMAGYFVFAIFAAMNMKNTNERIEEFKSSALLAIISAVILCYAVISLSGVSTFLYFNF